MAVYSIKGEKLRKVAHFFDGWEDTLIWSALQECMGSVFADSIEHPTAAQVVIADFCFLAGQPQLELVLHNPNKLKSQFIIMVPENEAWAKLIEESYGSHAKKIIRYAIKKEPNVFDPLRLKAAIESIGPDYEIKLIDEAIYQQAMASEWSRDLCSQFENDEAYKEKGLGVAVLYKGELVSGASSYTRYNEGIEIEIDTKTEFRRKGLAYAAAAKLILECIDRNLYPSWDAQNKWSVALAEKLGYHFDKEYTAYEISLFGL